MRTLWTRNCFASAQSWPRLELRLTAGKILHFGFSRSKNSTILTIRLSWMKINCWFFPTTSNVKIFLAVQQNRSWSISFFNNCIFDLPPLERACMACFLRATLQSAPHLVLRDRERGATPGERRGGREGASFGAGRTRPCVEVAQWSARGVP